MSLVRLVVAPKWHVSVFAWGLGLCKSMFIVPTSNFCCKTNPITTITMCVLTHIAIVVIYFPLRPGREKSFLYASKLQGRHWKDHVKSDLGSDQDHRLKKDLRSDQESRSKFFLK
jgi:hypothetical protein